MTQSKTKRNDVAARRPDRVNYLSWRRFLGGALVYKREQGGSNVSLHAQSHAFVPLFPCLCSTRRSLISPRVPPPQPLPIFLTAARHIPATTLNRSLFPSLLNIDAVEGMFSEGKLEFGVDAIGARFVDNARESLFTLPDSSIKAAMELGWTIQLHQPQRFADDLWRMMAAMEAEMGTLVGANAYLTPAKTQGLAPHWDDVHVAVLQMYGTKTWSVWEQRQSMNYSSGDLDARGLGVPSMVVEMRPGDVLLLPRGFIHQAVSGDEDSGHLTLSWGQVRGYSGRKEKGGGNISLAHSWSLCSGGLGYAGGIGKDGGGGDGIAAVSCRAAGRSQADGAHGRG